MQTVFVQTSTNSNEVKWFNRVMEHSEQVGQKYYEFAFAPRFHAQMGKAIEDQMLNRESKWRNGDITIGSDSSDSDAEVVNEPIDETSPLFRSLNVRIFKE